MVDRQLVRDWNAGRTVQQLAEDRGQPVAVVEAALADALRALALVGADAEDRASA